MFAGRNILSVAKKLLKNDKITTASKRLYSVESTAATNNFKLYATGALFLGGAATAVAMLSNKFTAHASSDALVPAQHPWSHGKPWESFDHASIRRGFQVYQAVCANCHSLNFIAYRNLVDVAFSEEEVKAMAADVDVEDGPNEEGEMFSRPGKLTDKLPRPYPNENAARAGNNGAYPVDLSLVVKARPHAEDYIFSLLTGYREPPAGVTVREGLYYNPYFAGGAIAMPQQLRPGVLTFDDGTEASISQLAKDVTTFLSWAAEPTHDERKRLGLKFMFLTTILAVPMLYWKKHKWSTVKTRKIGFIKHE